MTRAVLFDFYDTLARIEGGKVADARRRLAAACGVDYDRFLEIWRTSVSARTLGSLGRLEDEIGSMLRELEVECTEERLCELATDERNAWVGAVRLYGDTLPTLRALKARGFSLGLVSNCSSEGGTVLRANGLDARFDAMALSFEVGVAKPEPAIFMVACDRLDVLPDACVFVADGANGELDAARALGMTAVLVEHDDQHRAAVRSQSHDARVTSLTELLDLPFLESAATAK